MSKKRVPKIKNPFGLEPNPRGNYRRPTLKASMNYIARYKDEDMDSLSEAQKFRLLEAYRIVAEAKASDPNSLKRAQVSTSEDRGNYIRPSIAAARRYLESVKDYSEAKKSQEDIAWRIREAQMIVAAADRKNQRRKAKRASKPGVAKKTATSAPRAVRTAVARTPKTEKHVTKWEEVLGPEGEVIRFKLEEFEDGPNQGKFKARVLTKDEPQVGDIVLDATQGLKAWKITSSRRRPHPVTPQMRETYESSLLFKVRQMIAGDITLKQLSDHVKNLYDRVGNQRTV